MATAHIKEERNLKKFSVIDLFAGCGEGAHYPKLCYVRNKVVY